MICVKDLYTYTKYFSNGIWSNKMFQTFHKIANLNL